MSNGVPPTERSTIKLALMAQQLRAQLDADGVLDAEPIAIIGLGCRFPGGASSPAQYWQLLESGRDAITAVPEDRWDAGSFEEVPPSGVGTPRVSAPGVRWGGFLDRIREFDAEFFGLSPREASSMDPQQRLLLEVAYEAFEDAGLSRERLQGSHTGVYVASTAFDYAHLQLSSPESISAHSVTGSVHCIIANRLSFLFNLLGPSVTVDTACSSSLVALHMACQGLRDRETALAIAGGVNVILSPEIGLSLSQWGMMAPDGRCKTFDARADGFVRAEGCGVVVLKRLSDALVDGDRVLAVVRGSAVNQDGRSTAMTAPNGLAQQAVMRQALARGAVAPSQVSFVEAHGTGTVLGDPIEVEALAEVYGQPRDDGQPLVLGAVKTNIGHLEAAAGVAGVIKTVLALVHERIPRNLHFERLNPHISLAGTRVVLASEGRAWPMRAGRRIAGVSSFGFGGTNAHVLIEEAPRLPSRAPRELGAVVLPLSAHTETALRESARAMVAYLGDEGGRLPLADVVGTAARRRSHLDERLAVVGTTAAELGAGLQAWLDGVGSTAVSHGRRPSGAAPRVAFVFSGQGPQWWAMGRELLRDSRVFRDVVEACERVLSPIVGWSLLAELSADERHSRLDRTDIAQPALFAVQAGLVAQWRAWGIRPAAVAGHSVGEIAAAYAAGVLTLEDAVRVAAERGRAMESARGGRMASLECAAEEVARLLDEGGCGERLVLAAINGPASVVIAGDADAVEAFRAQLGGRDVGWRPLPVPFAFHSPHMASAASALRESLASLAPRPAEIPVVSTVTGRMAEHGDFGAAYWESNVREPVRFHRAMTTLIEAGHAVFVEIGPHPVLTLNVRQVLGASGRTGLVAHSLRRGQPERGTLLTNLGALFAHGCPVEWAGVHDTPHAVVSLPPYPWQRQAYWFEPPRPAASRLRGPASGEDDAPLLGRQLDSPALESEVFQASRTPDAASLIYRVAWQAAELADEALEHGSLEEPALGSAGPERVRGDVVAGTASGDAPRWLILADDRGVGRAVSRALRQQGARTVVVRADATCAHPTREPSAPHGRVDQRDRSMDGRDAINGGGDVETTADEWRVHPRDATHLREVIDSDGRSPAWQGVIVSWSLDDTPMAEPNGCAGLLYVAQSLLIHEQPPPVWLVTRGVCDLGSSAHVPDGLSQASAWGLAATIGLEHPELRLTCVDLDPATGVDHVTPLVVELRRGRRAERVAYRRGARHVARLVAGEATAGAQGVSVRGEGSYLVTGGSGALGQAVAGWLLERGAGHVVVASRSASSATTAALVERWPAAHGRVRAAAVDVADRNALAGLIDEIVASGSPLRGVVHAAGVLDDAAVMRATWARFDAVRRPKVHGAWYLHELTRGQPLDFFVLVSSASAVLGAAGQASYAAANAELDALARWRRAQGLPATSVGFGPWEGAGMAAAVADRLRAQGFGFMSPEAALGSLERLVAAGEPHALALQIDWRRYVQQRPGPPSAVLDGVVARPPQEPAAAPPRGLIEAVARTPLGGVRAVLLAHLDAQSRRVLGLSAGRAIAPTQPLQELGLDSLMAVELRNALSAELRRPLPATLLFDYPSLDALAVFLQALVVPDASSLDQPRSGQADDGSVRRARASSGDEASIDAAMIAGLSEEEAEALLLEELENSPNDTDRT